MATAIPGAARKRRRSQSPAPAGEGQSEPELSKPRLGGGGGGGTGNGWENLDLVLSLQGKELSLERKIELAFNFLTTQTNRPNHDHRADTVQILRVVSFIGNWVQSILISPENSKKTSESSDPVLDYRCWAILRVCIEKKPSISISPNLLKSLGHVARNGLSRVANGASYDDKESFDLFEQVLGCMSSVFSINTRTFFNAGVDLWASCAIEVISLAQKVSPNDRSGCTVLWNLGNCLFEQFSSFLRFYANPKNIFRTFVDRILDPLLELLVLLNSQVNSLKHKQDGSMLKVVEEILSNGLFHPQHVNGYFGLKNLNKSSASKDVIGSYHRHLFERFKAIKAENKSVMLAGFGYLLQLFVRRSVNQRASLAPRGTSMQKSSDGSEEPHHHRESLFEVFMQFMEPLILECKSFSEKDFANLGITKLVEVHCMLKSVNKVLATVIEEKIYVPTEDTLEGSYFEFLQDIYRVLVSMAEKMYEFWVSAAHLEDTSIKKMIPLLFAEIVDAVGHFLEIEYKVLGRDLVKLWLMIFALSATNASSKDIKPCFLLDSKISGLSSQVICTFSELRQVSFSIFTLCDAVRTFKAAVGAGVLASSFSVSLLSSDKCLESLATLLSSNPLRDAIRTSINSMPEGQSSRCIEELTLDLTGTLKWMILDVDLEAQGESSLVARDSVFGQRAELLGRHLSEIYTNVLESITVTTSNSSLVAKSVERLVDAIRPNLCHLVRNESNSSNEFVFSVIGKHISNKRGSNGQKIPSLSWLYFFFFRIYMSCRSLYLQSIGLMPPDLAIEATELMGNSFIVCCGKEWINSANILTEGYFAWIDPNSISLFDVIEKFTQSISRNCSGFTLLVFILHMAALQRLNDLNRQINAFDFLLEDNTNQFDKENSGDTELLKESSCLEATRLTSFMMSYVRLLSSGQVDSFQCYDINAFWNLSLCSLDEFSFPVATWQLLCENIDIWSPHASKKHLKNFFSNLIKFSFLQKRSWKDVENSGSQSSCREITLHNVSVDLLCDTIIYDRKVLLKNLVLSLCHALKKSVLPFVIDANKDNALLDSPPDLVDILTKLESEKFFGTDSGVTYTNGIDKLWICENLLNFLSTVPGFHANSKSFLQLIAYILHLERQVVPEHDDQAFNILENSALEHVKIMAELLEKSTAGIPLTVKASQCVIKLENCYNTVCWDRLLCTISCIRGFLWGLISALEGTCKDSISSPEERNMMYQYASRFSRYVATFETFIDICLHVLFMGTKDCELVDLVSVRLPQELDCENSSLSIAPIMDEQTRHQLEDNEFHSDGELNISTEPRGFDLPKVQFVKGFLLENLLSGEVPSIAFTLRELYNASAAIIKLKGTLSSPSEICRQTCSPFQKLSMGAMVGTAYVALQKIADMSKWPEFSLLWVDGILSYLEALGSFLTLPEINMPKELYTQVVNAHLRAIGKCILLQGKNATLPTHEIGSSTKTLYLQNVSGHAVAEGINKQNRLNSLKSRLRLSLRKYVNVSSNTHLNTALQVIERALVGVNYFSHSIYEVNTGNCDGGAVSSDVAAGIDCLYLILETVPGNKRVFKRTIPGLIGALFNIVLHLESPFIFYTEKIPANYPYLHPDAGAIVLMCIEVITAFVGRHSFQIDACHVSQCLHVPMTLFKGFKHLLSCRNVSHSCNQSVEQLAASNEYILDRQFSVDIEVARCVAVLEDSVNILLSCLESANPKMVSRAGYFSWNMEESMKCASFFRRIYEEMRQQRETLGKHSMYFLAGYISLYSGQGPFQTGITREIDEALRPGVYSLIDICEESDLQLLHTYLGEGPCRTTFANLVHDYKLQFQYQGKI
uniref:Nucleolar 27S pre-rRNA processing Urb2/Npa2 C-terminal domain-containing protein n=1 Tax=Leersia perrieri TaxID=77586 RepID=A0A0D9VQW5_9ORYZ